MSELRDKMDEIFSHDAYPAFGADPIVKKFNELAVLIRESEIELGYVASSRRNEIEELRAMSLVAAARTWQGTNGTDEQVLITADKFLKWVMS